jgi:uncharacterized protein (UPF0335 family)
MRLWTIHPGYLDTKGLLAVWREGLLAKRVLEGKTRGYRNHPQLERFRQYEAPLNALNAYLFEIWKEARRRGFNFDKKKIRAVVLKRKISVKSGQIEFEFRHLLKKLKDRDVQKYNRTKNTKNVRANPIFTIVEGDIERWERV